MIARKAQKKIFGGSQADSDESSQLKDYILLLAGANALILVVGIYFERKRENPLEMSKTELVISSLAVQKLARLLSKDKVTRPFRAPFTEYEGPAGAGEVSEVEKGSGLRRAVGELLTCPYCMTPWAAVGILLGYAFRPGITRTFSWVLAMTSVSHFLNQFYAKAKEMNK